MGQTVLALWMRSDAFRALQVHVREEQHDGTPVTLHLGLMCHLTRFWKCSLLPCGAWSGIPAAGLLVSHRPT